ncbi:MAG: IS110 family transposase [Rhodobacter sp.]|nr:IS110 family transposase [Rhodobacter sp.]MCA3514025.1 IS110 family transposase [Rhodobacter sp.]MCA3521452.1 IS110 family transposase [Rhodobacter sp.]MCA3523143.1 IS110 family transposase [Rhodobacter sp.]MCA3525189.1 IS110 family transposase [Rhodobacter sp.]
MPGCRRRWAWQLTLGLQVPSPANLWRLKDLVAADPALGKTRPASCKACPASLRLAAATLPAEAPEPGQPEARQIAALAGLAPIARESGTWRGKATIQGGRRHLRRAPTRPTLTAIRRTVIWLRYSPA